MKASLTRRDFLCKCSASLLAVRMGMGRAANLAASTEFRRGGMVYRRLGQTDLYPSLLSFGSHTDPDDRLPAGSAGTVLTATGQARRDRIIAHAFDLGVNLLDVYADQGQYEPTARLVRDRREKVLISLAHDTSARHIEEACRLFGHVDLYRFHTPDIDGKTLQDWDVLRKSKEAGKIRAIGISTHIERTMLEALTELEGLDYLFFPYNFIHARADYSKFLPEAQRRGVGLIAMKPLASGSIMKLDPLARPGAKPESESLELVQTRDRPILPAAVAELTKTLGRLPDETLCMAAMRFVYSHHFISTAITAMFEERLLEDNYHALATYQQMSHEEQAALEAARQVARLLGPMWLPTHYRWLEERWGA
jgi:aryl-alcohol dehydrogenase-like predicted oxidoreductase